MEAKQLYEQLEKDFINSELSDEWAQHMGEVEEFLSENFKKRSMGLVCDFANEINEVYTAVFPEKEVMQYLVGEGVEDAMLFVHHPSIWDITRNPVFYQMNKEQLMKFKEKRISIYNLHVPLDNYGEYSTSLTLAEVLGAKPEKAFGKYFGALAGVIASTELKTVQDLKIKFEEVIGHESKLYNYGSDGIQNGKIAFVGGGGNDIDFLKEIADANVKVLVTGITTKNEHSKKAHEFAEENKINILGGTHYSTEKFACIKMSEYFKKLGLTSEFIPGKPIMEDI